MWFFVQLTYEVPAEFEAEAEQLGSEARTLLSLCQEWQWVHTSELLFTAERIRYERATAYHSRIAFGGEDVPRVLLVPFFGIFHDLRLNGNDVLFSPLRCRMF